MHIFEKPFKWFVFVAMVSVGALKVKKYKWNFVKANKMNTFQSSVTYITIIYVQGKRCSFYSDSDSQFVSFGYPANIMTTNLLLFQSLLI